ncbi:MAG: signal peptide peptidase SppA [Novosphingobium sp.]|nr:signal peptide peptidase SppA [Novosphingobium sp.]MCP5401213.1 signal peptide peptidase SppA [Novosphingobium sp.]
MIFARKVWKLLVALKDGLALLFLLLFFMVLYAALTVRPSVGSVKEGALLLSLDGVIVEEPSLPDPLEFLIASEAPLAEYSSRDVVRALRAAAKDDRIKAVVLDLSRFMGGGMVHLQDVGAALDEVRAAKKPVLAYASYYGDDGVLLAAHASEVWVHPLGGAFIAGTGGNNLYYGRLLEKLKVTAHVFRVGTFKSAVEPWVRNDQSPEAREASKALYGALWDGWKADVAKARPKADIALVSTDPVGWLQASGGDAAKAAQAAHLVDKIGDETEFGERVAELVGEDGGNSVPGSFAHTRFDTWLAANKPKKPGKAIGVVTIAGEIVDGDAGPGLAGGDRIARLLDDALEADFAALVVRIDSPGGSMMASEQIRAAIERHRKQDIPVIASMANLGASGGYWVAMPASRIFAEPGTITGSIGVFAVVPSFERALSDIGVTTDGVKTTPLSGQPDLIGGLAPEVSGMIQANVESAYSRFLSLVGKSRGKSAEQVDRIGQGRVWDGGTARQLGLVDQFGGLDDALAYAAKAAKLEDGDWHAVYLGDGADPFATLLQRMRGSEAEEGDVIGRGFDWAAMAAGRQDALAARLLADVDRITGTRGLQAYCLECSPDRETARDRSARQSFLAAIARRFGLTAE